MPFISGDTAYRIKNSKMNEEMMKLNMEAVHMFLDGILSGKF